METRKRRRKVVGKRRERSSGEIERRRDASVAFRREKLRFVRFCGGFGEANAEIVEGETRVAERFERNRRAVRRFVEIESGAKMLADAAQDDEARRFVGGDLAQLGEKTARQLERKRVATFRAIQR